MKHTVTDIIRRGFENTVANWPLLLIRIGEGVLLVIMAVLAVVAILLPLLLSLGLNTMTGQDPATAAETLLTTLIERWAVLLYVVVVIAVVLTLLVAIHSFVEAGSARVYIDGDRAASSQPVTAGRARFRVFTAERWFAGGRGDWWSVFWIYNAAWAVAGLILLVPLLAVLALMLVFRDNSAAVIGIGCLGLAFFLLFAIAVAVVTNIWCQKAIVVCVARTHRAVGALGEAWLEFKADAGRHIGVAAILFLIVIVGSGFFTSISAVSGMSDSASFAVAMLPLQIIGSFANTVFSAVIAAWFLACFAALSVESR